MLFVYGKAHFSVSVSGVFWELFFSSEVACISLWETSDLLVKHLHHRQEASLIILYYKIGYDSNNLVFSGLTLASCLFRLAEIFALDR